MKIASLNIRHGGSKRVRELLDALAGLDANVILLTEFRENSNAPLMREHLFLQGYCWQASSVIGPSKNGVFLAARIPFTSNSKHAELGKHSHRLISATFHDIELVGAYFPQREEKRIVFDYLITKMLPNLGERTVLLGDFNTGKHLLDEIGQTFHCADRFDALEGAGLTDSWRSRNPHAREFSWESSAKNGFRLDHVFCSTALDQKVCKIGYLHDVRLQKTSDHSAMFVHFDFGATPLGKC